MFNVTSTVFQLFRDSKRNFARRNKDSFGAPGQAATSLKIEDLSSNKTIGKLSYMLHFRMMAFLVTM